ncbi:hypothetical protein WR25_11233 [Diploscapter pachys]|uniref:Uncharacterized protein n=1 Tax=Diploscapter pachys TaxID=2018661 RepID=A0A2A2KD08_9BILA|nr:hypothetical protein WR25_11233 [Diploscapter pachys]
MVDECVGEVGGPVADDRRVAAIAGRAAQQRSDERLGQVRGVARHRQDAVEALRRCVVQRARNAAERAKAGGRAIRDPTLSPHDNHRVGPARAGVADVREQWPPVPQCGGLVAAEAARLAAGKDRGEDQAAFSTRTGTDFPAGTWLCSALCAAARNVIGHDQQAIDALVAVGALVADQIDLVVLGQAQLRHVGAVHQHDVARAFDAAEPVVIAIDGRVELIVRAQRHQAEAAGGVLETGGVQGARHVEFGAAAVGEPLAVGGGHTLPEAAGDPHPLVEAGELVRIGRLDRIADEAVIADPRIPIDLRVGIKCRLGDAGEDRRFAEQRVRRRRRAAAAAVDAAETVLHRHRLRAGCLFVGLDPAQAGEKVAGLAGQQMRAVKLGRDADGEVERLPCRLDPCGIGHRAGEVAAQAQERLRAAVDDMFACLDRVPALVARGIEVVELLQPVERGELGLFGDADGALSLHVAVAANRAEAGAGPADVAAQ